MSPSDVIGELGLRIGAVVNDEIGPIDQLQNSLVGLPRDVLGIGEWQADFPACSMR